MEEPIRIVQVLGIMNYGGAENFIMNVYRNIDRSKVQFDFVVHTSETGAFDSEIESLGGKIYHCPKFSWKNYFLYKKWWKTFFKEHSSYKVIHSHIRSTASIILKIAKKNHLATVVHSHSTSNGKGFSSFVKRVLQSKITKYSDMCFACSQKAGEWLFGEKEIKKDNYYVIKNGIDLQKYDYNEEVRKRIRETLNINDEKVVIHVGRFHPVKNHKFIINLFSKILQKDKSFKLVLVGDGDLRSEIESMINEYGISNNVILVGNVSNVNEYLMAADYFILPSLWEGLPVTVIEAQAAGLPCLISSNITEEVVVSNLVKRFSILEYDEWISNILNSDLKKHDVRSDLIKSGYDIHSVCSDLLEKYTYLNNK